jgi:hypothetical protein
MVNAGADLMLDWIELFNPSSSTVSLAGVKLGDEETPGGGEGMLQFPAGARLEPGQVMVIASQADLFYSLYGFNPSYETSESDPTVPNLVPYTSWGQGALNLLSSGDEVLALDGSDELVDALSWGSSAWAFNPPAPQVAVGHSLERYPPGVDTGSAADWIEQSNPNPGQVPPAPAWFEDWLSSFWKSLGF